MPKKKTTKTTPNTNNDKIADIVYRAVAGGEYWVLGVPEDFTPMILMLTYLVPMYSPERFGVPGGGVFLFKKSQISRNSLIETADKCGMDIRSINDDSFVVLPYSPLAESILEVLQAAFVLGEDRHIRNEKKAKNR